MRISRIRNVILILALCLLLLGAVRVQAAGLSGSGTQVQTDGGLLSVDLDGEDIDLTGPAELTFTGDLPELPT